MSITLEAPRGVAVINARNVVAVCVFCDSLHDPYESTEFDCCVPCLDKAIERSRIVPLDI